MLGLARETTPMDAETARFWVLAPAAVGQVIDCLEALTRLEQYGPEGMLRGRSAHREQGLIPLSIRERLDTMQGAATLKVAELCGAALVLTGRHSRNRQVAGAALMFAASWLGELRNAHGRDGSDQMSSLIAGYRVLTAAIPDTRASDDLFLRAVNAQTALSYAASGLAKLISSTWLSGDALDQVLRTRLYGESFPARFLKDHRSLGRLVNWATIAWESAYPLVYLTGPRTSRAALLAVKGFHLGIAATMGLPRFFWGFSSAHAAAQYVIDSKGQSR